MKSKNEATYFYGTYIYCLGNECRKFTWLVMGLDWTCRHYNSLVIKTVSFRLQSNYTDMKKLFWYKICYCFNYQYTLYQIIDHPSWISNYSFLENAFILLNIKMLLGEVMDSYFSNALCINNLKSLKMSWHLLTKCTYGLL